MRITYIKESFKIVKRATGVLFSVETLFNPRQMIGSYFRIINILTIKRMMR